MSIKSNRFDAKVAAAEKWVGRTVARIATREGRVRSRTTVDKVHKGTGNLIVDGKQWSLSGARAGLVPRGEWGGTHIELWTDDHSLRVRMQRKRARLSTLIRNHVGSFSESAIDAAIAALKS